uniref:Movement protein TGB2 n=1 Tax=Asian prunus virus 2 TaxID=351426 RepID=A0A1L3KK75_9VIRU|nr:triple gene block protein 2 [Asian prunus virus 2]
MPSLTPPPDNTRVLLPIAIGLGVGVVIWCLTRSTLPQVGDNIHSLPHGGNYLDGTKRISYCGPKDSFPSSNLFKGGAFSAICVVVLLVFAIHVSELFNRPNRRSCGCGSASHA